MLSYGSVNLWALERQDLGQHYRWSNDDALRRLLGQSPRPRSFPELEAWMAAVITDTSQEIYSIKTPQAELVGWLHLQGIDLHHGCANVGLAIDPEFWRQGYGRDALTAACIYAFEDRRLSRLEAEILALNTPSRGLFAGLGFQHEGTRREAVYTAGRRLDVELYGLLARDFQRPKRPSASSRKTTPPRRTP